MLGVPLPHALALLFRGLPPLGHLEDEVKRFKREPLTLFAKCGMVLYGDQYVHQLAEALGVADRSVQRWSSGARDVPPDIWEQLEIMLRDERVLVTQTATEVARHLSEVAT